MKFRLQQDNSALTQDPSDARYGQQTMKKQKQRKEKTMPSMSMIFQQHHASMPNNSPHTYKGNYGTESQGMRNELEQNSLQYMDASSKNHITIENTFDGASQGMVPDLSRIENVLDRSTLSANSFVDAKMNTGSA